ncbi:MAG: transcriptional regulator GcvA [Rhodocyclaceae bacterium]|nr:transcriptional regulator GcvA [Rhodocyclaceae bacterium]
MKPRIPPLHALRAFEAAARHLSFKRAASELHVTPGAISQQIKLVEAQLGVELFVRRTRAVALTDQARAMLPPLRQALGQLAAAVEATAHAGPSGRLSVCTPPSFAARWLVPRLPAFTEAYPEVDLHLSTSLQTIDKRNVTEQAEAAQPSLDADILVRFGRGEYPGWISDRLLTPSYVPVCAPSRLEGAHPLKQAADLQWHPLIHDDTLPDLEDRPTWLQWLALAGVPDLPTRRGPHFDDPGLVVASAMAGHGVALAARPLVSAEVAAGRLCMPFALAIPSRFAYFVCQPAATAARPAAVAFRRWIVATADRDHLAEQAGS